MQDSEEFDQIETPDSQLLPSPVILRLLEASSQGYKCKGCGLIFAFSSELKIHQHTSDKLIKCVACREYFTTTLGMKKHYGKVHAKYRPSKCNYCKKRFRNKYAAKRHFTQVHEESSRIQCENCGKVLYNKFSLSRHIKICRY